MGSSGGFPVDLVLFGMIAAFLVLRLRSILGKRTGYERPPELRPVTDPLRAPDARKPATIIEGRAEPVPARPLPDPASPAGQALARLHGADGRFEPTAFMNGAEAAFRLIVAAFAEGRRDALRPLLSPEMFTAFETAIAGREEHNEVQHTDIKNIHKVTIEDAELHGSVAHITVKFVTDQVSYATAAGAGAGAMPVSGTDATTEITDLWTFERDLSSSDPTWRLIAARSA